MIIWRDSLIKIWLKFWHIHKFNKKAHRDFAYTEGDIPVCRINEQTGKLEDVENHRGEAYALRNARKFRNKKRYCRRKKHN